MSRKNLAQKMNQQKVQLRSILSDYRKAKFKCIALAEELKQQLPNRVHFDSVQRQTVLKMELLDLQGLVSLKNTLVKTLSQLFDIETNLNTKKDRQIARKQMGNYATHNLVQTASPKGMKNISLQDNDRRINKLEQHLSPRAENPNFDVFIGKRAQNAYLQDDSIIRKSKQKIRKQLQNQRRAGSPENSPQGDQVQQITWSNPDIEKMKQQLERYRMREEQIDRVVQKKVALAIEQFFQQGELIEENSSYKIIKIYKNSIISQQQSSVGSELYKKSPSEANLRISSPRSNFGQMRRMTSMQLPTYAKSKYSQKKEKDKDVMEIEEELAKDEYNVDEVVSRISSTLENSEFKLRELRKQRQRIIMEDDVWAQFEQM